MIRRATRPDLQVRSGERLLAWARSPKATVGGSRDALYLRLEGADEVLRLPWEHVESAQWDSEASVLTLAEVGEWGQPRPEHFVELENPSRLLQLIRERVTASVVLQRHVPLEGRRSVRVIARRAPSGRGDVHWFLEYDVGVDPDNPDVRRRTAAALAAARDEVGLL
jgi:hypothetical protein